MNLRSGITISPFPFFRPSLLDSELIRINGGVERIGEEFFSKEDWRPPTPEEVATLTSPIGELNERSARISILEVPNHLREGFWRERMELRENERGGTGGAPSFMDEFVEYCRFKRLPITQPFRATTLARVANNASLSLDCSNGSQSALGDAPVEYRRASFTINLGDEPTSLVFVNLSIETMAELLGEACSSKRRFAEAFMAQFTDYPIVRMLLPPGYGYMLYPGEILHAHYSIGNTDPEILLQIDIMS